MASKEKSKKLWKEANELNLIFSSIVIKSRKRKIDIGDLSFVILFGISNSDLEIRLANVWIIITLSFKILCIIANPEILEKTND